MTQIFEHDQKSKKIENESNQWQIKKNKQIIKERVEKHGKISKMKTSKKNVIN